MDDKNETSVGLVIGQTVRVCPRYRYRLWAQIFFTDARSTGVAVQDRYADLHVDEVLVASVDQLYIRPGTPYVWTLLSSDFYMNANDDTLTVKVRFLADSSYTIAQWGVDNVVLTRVVE